MTYSIRDSSIGISWHMGEGCSAVANGVVRGSLRLHDGKESYGFPTLDIFMEDPNRASVAAAAINGELTTALRRFIVEYEDMQSETEGQYPHSDGGCIECTCGTVPNTLNTGLCLYHLVRKLLPDPVKAEDAA